MIDIAPIRIAPIRIVKMYTEEPDRRYRVLVQLRREDRPKYWTFHCPHCQQPMCELGGANVIGMTDFYDPQDASRAVVGMRCSSPMCKWWYYFELS